MVTDSESPTPGEARRGERGVRTRCPGCGRRTARHENPHRPFCSLACRLRDLGLWLDEQYRIASDADDSGSRDVP